MNVAYPARGSLQNPHIIYSTPSDIVFTHLRAQIDQIPPFREPRFGTVFVDEADGLFLDTSQNPFYLSSPYSKTFNAIHFIRIFDYVRTISAQDLVANSTQHLAELRSRDFGLVDLPDAELLLHLASAYKAHHLKKDVHYVVQNNKVIIVDQGNTERLQLNHHWEHGIHEYVMIREKLTLRPPPRLEVKMSFPTFIQLYSRVFSVSGTFGDGIERKQIRDLYNLVGFDTPTHQVSRRIDSPIHFVSSQEEQDAAVLADIAAARGQGRPLLLHVQSIDESIRLHTWLTERGCKCQLLNNFTNLDENGEQATEDAIVQSAGVPGCITVATSVAGRGTDFKPSDESLEAGGLKVISLFLAQNSRVELQTRGRAGRQGAPGESLVRVCLETDLFIARQPAEIRQCIDTIAQQYGYNSPELAVAVTAVRRATNLLRSIQLQAEIEREKEVDTVLHEYLSGITSLTRSLEALLCGMKDQIGIDAPKSIARAFVHRHWVDDFDSFQEQIAIKSFFLDKSSLEDHTLTDLDLRVRADLQTLFTEAVKELPATSSLSAFSESLAIIQDYFSQEVPTESFIADTLGKVISEGLDQLRMMATLNIERCLGEFEDADVDKVRAYLEEIRNGRGYRAL